MKVVIDISDRIFKINQNRRLNITDTEILEKALRDGTPLPKGHKVIDAYALQEHLALVPMEDRTYRETVEIIDRFPSIIEADKESD